MKKSFIRKFLSLFFICVAVISCSYSSTYSVEDLVEGVDGDYSVLIHETSTEIVVTPVGITGDIPGFIFYPGALVSYDAYLPLMTRLSAKGFKCIIVNMPGDMAFNDSNAAKRYIKKYSEISRWYLSGHSLGGAMAASYISSNTDKFEGLVLLAAYSTKDLSDSGLRVLSVYGTNDGVLNWENMEKYKSNLPSDYVDLPITGGNHANFANYGAQKGDNESSAEMPASEQQRITAEAICSLAGL